MAVDDGYRISVHHLTAAGVVVVVDDDGHVVAASPSAVEALGSSDLLGRATAVVDAARGEPFAGAVSSRTVTVWVEGPSGPGPAHHGVASAIELADGRPATLVELDLDALAHAALHDALTGLPNRRYLVDHLEHLLARAVREPVEAGLLVVDLDGFTAINDRYGHDAGDRVLAEVGDRLVRNLRTCDIPARLGGDEFVVLCDSVGEHEAPGLAQRIAALIAVPIDVGEAQLPVTGRVSVHLIDGRGPHADATAVLKAAGVS